VTVDLSAVISVPEAAARVGCSPARIRSLVRSGELPASRVGGQWFIDEHSLDYFCDRIAYAGRVLSQRLAWSLLATLQGRSLPVPLHREERARLARYLSQPLEQLCHRLRGRAVVASLSATSAALTRMRADSRWVIGGAEAAARYVEFENPPERVSFYVRKSLEEDFLDVSLAVPDELSPNLYLLVVEDSYWPFDGEIDRFVWGSVAYLDCREQKLTAPRMGLLWPPPNDSLDGGRADFEESGSRKENSGS